MANTRYEDWAVAQQSLMMGFGSGGGIDMGMSQSYRSAVLKAPPPGDFQCQVVQPCKQGGTWHYGCHIIPPHGSPSTSQQGFTIYRKWEDCLDLQKILEREFSYLSCNQRKLIKKAKTASSFYHIHERAASFDSLPDGPDPINLALDIHTHLPKLSKKTTLFGKANTNLLACREAEFKTFIEAFFSIDMPLMQDVRGRKVVRDWFAYWRRDREASRKSGAPAIPGTMMAGLTPRLGVPEPLPGFSNYKRASTNSSVSGSSSSDWHPQSSRSESVTGDEEMMDSFPKTPEGLPFSLPSSSVHSNSSSSLLSPTIPPSKPRSYDSPYFGGAFALGGMMVPVSRSKSRSSRQSASSTPSHPSTPAESVRSHPVISAPIPRQRSDSDRAPESPVPATPTTSAPMIQVSSTTSVSRTPRQRPMSSMNAANRKGRVFVSPPDDETTTEQSLHMPQPSVSRSRPQTAPSRSSSSSGYSRSRFDTTSIIHSTTSTLVGDSLAAPRNLHFRKNSSASVDSFIDVKLPYSAPEDEAVHSAPAVQSRRRNRRSASRAAARHSISSIEAYLSDSSIDAAISKMRISGPTANAMVNASAVTAAVVSPSGLRRSFSGGGSRPSRNSFIGSNDKVPEETVADDGDSYVVANRGHESVIDSYFYSPNSVRPPSSKASHRLSTQTHSSVGTDLYDADEDQKSVNSHLGTRNVFQIPWTPNSEAGHTSSSGSHYSCPGSPHRYGGPMDDCFAVKCTIPAALDSAAVVCRIPRTTTFEELHEKLQQKFEEAEGISLRRFSIGVAQSPRYGRSSLVSSKTNSIGSSVFVPPSPAMSTGRMRSGSVISSSGSMIDPSQLTIIKNQSEWAATIPGAHEKLTLHILVDE